MKKTRLLIATMMLFGFVAAPLATVTTVEAQGRILTGIDDGATRIDPEADGDAEEQVNNIISTVINIFSLVVGVISVIMIIIGGFKYITSGGDSGNVTSAKNTILYAVIGLVVVALAQIIVRFVVGRLTNPEGI